MPTVRQHLISSIMRHYPFYSGLNRFTNRRLIELLAGGSTDVVWTKVPGGEVLASLNDYVGRLIFYTGDLDRRITWICAKLVQSGDTVCDIGANIGLVTIWLSVLVGARGNVHTFEPNPDLQKILRRTFTRNKISNVTLHCLALGEKDDVMELRVPHHNAGLGSLVRNRNSDNCKMYSVPVRTLSEVVSQNDITSIRLIKIDVEGFEENVLRGSENVLREVRPEAILFEMNEQFDGKTREQSIIKILRDFDYCFFSIPRCWINMKLERFDPDKHNRLLGNDYLAAPKGEAYEAIAKLVGAND